jgi:hypothetical protein
MAMLAESSTRLLWLYYLCFPSLVAEIRFDVGKLLQSSFDNEVGTDYIAGPTSGLDTLRRLHVLRLLRESDQFLGFGKSGELYTRWLVPRLICGRFPLVYQYSPKCIRFCRRHSDSGRD